MSFSSGPLDPAVLDPDRLGPTVDFSLSSRSGGSWRGERDARVDAEAISAAMAAHESSAGETLKRDERSVVRAVEAAGLAVVVKEVRKPGLKRRLADVVRGSPARRAFRAGRQLIKSGVGAALPLAAVERRRLGVPMRSLLVSLDLRDEPSAARWLADSPETRTATLSSLSDLLLALHRAGAVHGDLRAQHAHCSEDDQGLRRARLIDLEGVRFESPPRDDARLDDWAQINGSIPDAHASEAQRRAGFDRYASQMPFETGADAAFEEMTRRSVARQHLYTGREL